MACAASDVAGLIAVAYGRALRRVAGAIGKPIAGLSAGARRFGFSSALHRKLFRLDTAFSIVRHITEPHVAQRLGQLDGELAARAHEDVVREKGRDTYYIGDASDASVAHSCDDGDASWGDTLNDVGFPSVGCMHGDLGCAAAFPGDVPPQVGEVHIREKIESFNGGCEGFKGQVRELVGGGVVEQCGDVQDCNRLRGRRLRRAGCARRLQPRCGWGVRASGAGGGHGSLLGLQAWVRLRDLRHRHAAERARHRHEQQMRALGDVLRSIGTAEVISASVGRDGSGMGASHMSLLHSSSSCAAHRRLRQRFIYMPARALQSTEYEIDYLRICEEDYDSDIQSFAEAYSLVMATAPEPIMQQVTLALESRIDAFEDYQAATGGQFEIGCFSDYTWNI